MNTIYRILDHTTNELSKILSQIWENPNEPQRRLKSQLDLIQQELTDLMVDLEDFEKQLVRNFYMIET